MSLALRKLPSLITLGVVFAAALIVLGLVNRPPASSPSGGGLGTAAATPVPTSSEARIEGLQTELQRRNGDPQSYALLGEALLARLRETGETALYSRAETAFGEALRREPRNLHATVGLGTLALTRHDFSAALRHGRRARRINRGSFAPFAVLVDAHIELGRYGAARRTLQRMIDFKPALASYARVSYFRELHGDLPGALDAMRRAESAAPAPGESRSYIQSLLGDLELGRGRPAAAETSYRAALTGVPGYPPAVAGLARVDAARGRLGSAIDRLGGLVERLPLPTYAIALGETELAAGRRAAAQANFDLVRAQQQLLGASGVNAEPELAVFEADHGDRRTALALARRGYAAAPSVRSADALGWALTSARRPAAGLVFARRALRLGSRDPLFLYHAGIAARATGELDAARSYLSRALAANPRFSPLHGRRAQRALEGLR